MTWGEFYVNYYDRGSDPVSCFYVNNYDKGSDPLSCF